MNPYQNAPAPYNPMAQFGANVAQADPSGSGKWFDPGSFDLRVRLVSGNPQGKDKKGNAAVWFAIEFEILASTNPAFPVGSTANVARNLFQSRGSGDTKAVLLGLAGLDPKDTTFDQTIALLIPRLCAHDNPAMGLMVHLEAFGKSKTFAPSQQNPQGETISFTNFRWSGAPPGQKEKLIAIAQSQPPIPQNGFAPPQGAPQGYGAQPMQPPPQQYGAPPGLQFAPQGYQPPVPQNGFAPQGAPQAPTGLPPGYRRLDAQWIIGPDNNPVRG